MAEIFLPLLVGFIIGIVLSAAAFDKYVKVHKQPSGRMVVSFEGKLYSLELV